MVGMRLLICSAAVAASMATEMASVTVESGGQIRIKSGAVLTIGGNDSTSSSQSSSEYQDDDNQEQISPLPSPPPTPPPSTPPLQRAVGSYFDGCCLDYSTAYTTQNMHGTHKTLAECTAECIGDSTCLGFMFQHQGIDNGTMCIIERAGSATSPPTAGDLTCSGAGNWRCYPVQ